jgi:hypothetical protein
MWRVSEFLCHDSLDFAVPDPETVGTGRYSRYRGTKFMSCKIRTKKVHFCPTPAQGSLPFQGLL